MLNSTADLRSYITKHCLAFLGCPLLLILQHYSPAFSTEATALGTVVSPAVTPSLQINVAGSAALPVAITHQLLPRVR